MAIEKITETDLIQRCARCEAQNRIALDQLVAGIQFAEGQADEAIVALPQCPRCHAQEFLVRSHPSEEQYPGRELSAGHLHRLVVDELHASLVGEGRVSPALKKNAEKVFTRAMPKDVRARFFEAGLELPKEALEELLAPVTT